MVNSHLASILCKDILAIFCAASISVSSSPLQLKDVKSASPPVKTWSFKNTEKSTQIKKNLWLYLRKGINYLEASGKDVPLALKHPGGRAYGPLALTPIAIKDVQMHYPRLAHYKLEDVLSKRSLYEKFAFLYASLLLNHYVKIDVSKMPKEEVFVILQKAWFLGPTLYMKGHLVIASREARAKEYLFKNSKS